MNSKEQLLVSDLVNIDPDKIVTTLRMAKSSKTGKTPSSSKTAYLIIRNGRPYFYTTINHWDSRHKKVRSEKKYLGTSLPRGYRLTNK